MDLKKKWTGIPNHTLRVITGAAQAPAGLEMRSMTAVRRIRLYERLNFLLI